MHLAIFCGCTAQFVSDMVGNPDDPISRGEAHLVKVYINDDPGMTLTYLTARSNWVTCTFEWGKLLQSHLMEENLQQSTILTEYYC